jgi:hypothetical protein
MNDDSSLKKLQDFSKLLKIQMKTHGHHSDYSSLRFMGRPDMGDFPMSRDFGMGSIPCELTACICNKKGKCEVPSKVHINNQGKCKGFQVAGKDFEF